MKGPRNKYIYPIAYARNRICIYRGSLCVLRDPKKQQNKKEPKNKRIYVPSEWIPCGQHLFLIHYSKLHIIIIIDGFSIIIFFLFLFSNIQKNKNIFRICFCVFVFSKKKKISFFSFADKFLFFFSLRHFSYTLCNNEKRKQMNNKRWTHTTTTAEGFFLFCFVLK